MNDKINVNGFKELINSQSTLLGEAGATRMNTEPDYRDRNDFQKDYARILYSSSFRRLQGKMQLMAVNPDSFERNRLTHSIEVAQIARSIAENVHKWSMEYLDSKNEISIYGNSKDLYIVELGGLAHDIGNPPFGHHGERLLNELMKDRGGFEGNAQSIRNLMQVEKKHPHLAGLNLTIRSLLSIIKYNVSYEQGNEKFLYDEQFQSINKFLRRLELEKSTRTLDVQIVDAADEIAYCAHDLEDALSKHYFSINEFIYDLK
ncbi:deoxyguanosinetriphosphate triphosphohydrolase family protein [Alkalibacterium kapii]|uniref:HD domain-containing protein n=1 Tax=Alkalibacterium kapii TaxID=426704 RepID=A0A511ATF0_9LACT|nr:dNTP triphosphohydrolase [Alkalibacterium kapii]GEK90992.1 hypothetical protein AKA01nite_06140 [Alkalibacterium kapii]